MDHDYIDRHVVADRYLKHTLPPQDLGPFEAHLAECEECQDRVLLAGMFQAHNGIPAVVATVAERSEQKFVRPAAAPRLQYTAHPAAPYRKMVTKLPKRAIFVAKLRPWQIWLILSTAALMLVLITAAGVLILTQS